MPIVSRGSFILVILIALLTVVESKPQIPLIIFTDVHHHIHTPEPYSLEWLYQVARNRNFTEIDSVKNNLDYLINLVSTALDTLEYQYKTRNQELKNKCKNAAASYAASAIPWVLLAGAFYNVDDSCKELVEATIVVGFTAAALTSGFLFLKGTFTLKDAYDHHKYLPSRIEYHRWLLGALKKKKADVLASSRQSS